MCGIEPFEGVDLSTVPYDVYDTLRVAKESIEDAEIEMFLPAIAASGPNTSEGKLLQMRTSAG